MAGYGFLFPGQGSQHPGMGADLLADPELTRLCDSCGEAAGIDLAHLLTEAGEDELRLTQNAQPALTFTGIALALVLRRQGVDPTATAGHSVGEYAALCAAGAMSPEEAVAAVTERGRAMAQAAPPGTTSMSAVLGLGPDAVERAIADLEEVWAANFNTPTQTVIGGTTAGLEAAAPVLLGAGARRVIPLSVSAGFHTPLVAAAAARLRPALEGIGWREPAVPVVANLTADAYPGAAAIPEILEGQLRSPVLWSASIARLAELGCDWFLELGPKRALTGMMRELAPSASAAALATPAACAQFAG